MATGAALVILTGLLLWRLPFGEGWINTSYDISCLFAGPSVPQETIIIGMDQVSHDRMGISYGQWPRSIHARLLDHLCADGCRLVVFDVVFTGTNAVAEDDALRAAFARQQDRVVLAAVRTPNPDANFASEYTRRPTNLMSAATRYGIVGAKQDRDMAVRQLFTGLGAEPSLAWAAAEQCRAPLPNLAAANQRHFWMRYYGSAGTIRYLSYHQATNQAPGFYRDKIAIIGGKPSPLFLDEKADVFRTPFTAWTGQLMPGVELVATMFLNLLYHDYVQRMPDWGELLLLVLASLLFGGGLVLARPLKAVGLAALGMMVVAVAGLALFWLGDLWWGWTVVAGGQIPCALAWSIVYRTHWLNRTYESALAAPAGTRTMPLRAALSGAPTGVAQPDIAEHTLVRKVGEGAYGEVWLARDVLGNYRAAKVIYRARFGNDSAPYEREYRGISAYGPVSLSHPGLLHVLQVGRRDAEGYFYYVMELGDDKNFGQAIEPGSYTARNLDLDLDDRKRLPVGECIEIIVQLAGALDHLHRHGLVHRDIKPSNIVFMKGVPKLADIGLVTHMAAPGREVSLMGTEGYMPPEGPGSPAGDIYGLGIVLYRMGTGQSARQFPALPETLYDWPDCAHVMQLNEIIRTATAPEPEHRHRSAADLRVELLELKQCLRRPPTDTTPL